MTENKEQDTEREKVVPVLCSQRWILAYIGFLGLGVVCSLRLNIASLLSAWYGGRRVLFVTVLFSSLVTLLIPVCARTSVYIVFTIRVVLGLLTGTNFPAMHAVWERWAPELERSKLGILSNTGTIGSVLTFSTSGLLCTYGYDNGWGSIFYLTGALGILWTSAWFYIAADTSASHPRIKEEKIKYITRNIEYDTENKNGGLSAVSYFCDFLSSILAGPFADFLRSGHVLSTTLTRKCFQTFAFAGTGVRLIGTGFFNCDNRGLAVLLLFMAVMFSGFSIAGFVVNHVNFAPKYAGVLFGISNTVATIPGMTAPLLAGYLTPYRTSGEWRNVFYVCAGFDAFGILIFCLFASGELQDWAKDEDFEVEIPVGTHNESEKNIASFENDSIVHTNIDSGHINYCSEEK